MNEIGKYESTSIGTEDLFSIHAMEGTADDDASEADAQAFMQMLDAGESSLADSDFQDSEFQEQFDKNFQAFSYTFMKIIYSHVEDEIRKQ